MNKILIPTDGSKATNKAAKFVSKQTEVFDSEVHIICIQKMTGPQGGVTGPRVYKPDSEELIEDYMNSVEDHLDSDTEVIKNTKKGTSVASEIIEYANNEDIGHIVMGTTGKTGAERILAGSVAEKVVRKADCPVTTVKSSG